MNEKKPAARQPKSLSFTRLVNKILAEPEFAAEIHNKVRAARAGDRTAIAELDARLKFTARELDALKLPGNFPKGAFCTGNTTLYMLDFALVAAKQKQR